MSLPAQGQTPKPRMVPTSPWLQSSQHPVKWRDRQGSAHQTELCRAIETLPGWVLSVPDTRPVNATSFFQGHPPLLASDLPGFWHNPATRSQEQKLCCPAPDSKALWKAQSPPSTGPRQEMTVAGPWLKALLTLGLVQGRGTGILLSLSGWISGS